MQINKSSYRNKHFDSHLELSFPISTKANAEEKISFLLRFGILGCFVGHGAWGLIGKEGWLPFFNVFFFNEGTSRQLMPFIGMMDIAVGIFAFFYPTRALLYWAAFWTLFTAMLRPSAGMGMSEFFERAGNYGIPLAMLFITGAFHQQKSLFKKIQLSDFNLEKNWSGLERILRWSLVALLIGHGGLAFFNEHQGIAKHLNFIGIHPSREVMMIFGGFEMLLGVCVFFFPRTTGLLYFVLTYKLFTELMHPIAGQSRDVFETIERMGDYIIPPILLIIYAYFPKKSAMV